MVFHKQVVLISVLGVFSIQSLFPKQSMQDFFDQNYQKIRNVVQKIEPFDTIKPKLEALVKDGGNINELFVHPSDREGNLTLLMYAGHNGSIELTKWLLAHGADSLIESKNSRTTVFGWIMVSMVNMFYWPPVEIESVVCDQLIIIGLLLDAMKSSDRKIVLEQLKDVIFNESVEADDESIEAEKQQLVMLLKHGVLAFLPLFCYKHKGDFNKITSYFMDVLDKQQKEQVVQMVADIKKADLVDPVTQI